MRNKISDLFPGWLWITIAYLAIHVPMLLALPIFADEAIYIHWAQLVTDDAARYGFFSMSDGKPPLFMWLLSLTTRFAIDPLMAARLTAVGIGLVTVFVVGMVARALSGNKRIVLISQIITICAPFWWFYHRMALMDGLLTLFVTLSFYCALRIAIKCQKERGIAYDTIPMILFLGFSFGAALMTKTPALFAIPIIAITPFFALVSQKGNVSFLKKLRAHSRRLFESFLLIGIGGVIGCGLFALLKVSPFFGALFARGSDFTFSLSEVVGGEWKFVLFSSLPREFGWVTFYLTYALIVCAAAGLFYTKTRRQILFLLAATALFAAPLIAFGRVLYPRYFLPIAPFLTIAAAIGFEQLRSQKKTRMIAYLIAVTFFLQCALFILPGLFKVDQIPFTAIDRMQYLEEWSAGYGNSEVRDFIRDRYTQVAGQKKIIVLTEGSFGTLPDGLSIYFFGPLQLDGVEIHGIGVGPTEIPKEYLKDPSSTEVYYVVNSHRFRIANTSSLEKIFEVRRPNDSPSLLFFKVRK